MRRVVRRIAVHDLLTVDGSTIHLCVVEMVDGIVVNYYKFDREPPYTEWLGGKAVLNYDDDNNLRVYLNGTLLE